MLALLLLVRARLSWRDVVPVVAFLAAGLLAMRNLPIAAVVLAPVLGRVLKRPDSLPPLPPTPASRQRVNRVFAVAIVAAFVVFGLSIKANDPLGLSGYPVEATDFLEEQRPAGRAPPGRPPGLRGQLLRAPLRPPGQGLHRRPLRHVPGGGVPGLPAPAQRAPGVAGHPRHPQIDVVLWDRDLPLTSLLKASGQWLEVYAEGDWVVAAPRCDRPAP